MLQLRTKPRGAVHQDDAHVARNRMATDRLLALLRKHHAVEEAEPEPVPEPAQIKPDPVLKPSVVMRLVKRPKAISSIAPRATIDEVIKAVSDHYGISRDKILSPSRDAKIVYARHVACYLARILTRRSFLKIGRKFRRDHTSVYQGIRKIVELRRTDLALDADLRAIEQNIQAALGSP